MALQLKNPFKKQQDQLRAADGKFTSGSGGLNTLKNFNWKRALPVVLLISIAGGYFVFRSFAGSLIYNYQFSRSECSTVSNPNTKALSSATQLADSSRSVNPSDLDCDQQSAEAMVYRMYQGVLGREPDPAGFKFWVQKLAGDRAKPSEMATQLLQNKSISNLSAPEYVTWMYKQFNGRSQPDDKGLAFWTKHLNDKSWSRSGMAAHFAAQKTSKDFYQSRYAAYIAKVPALKISQDALNAQKTRTRSAASNAVTAKTYYKAALKYAQNTKMNLSAAKNIASKSVPSSSDLTVISFNEKTARATLANAQKAARLAKSNYLKADALAQNASKVAKYSPDISDSGVKSERNKALLYSNGAEKATNQIVDTIKSIAGQYQIAEKKYAADQIAKQQAAEAAAQRQGSGTTSDSAPTGYDTPDPVDVTPVPVGRNTIADKTAWCRNVTGSYRYHSSNRHVTYTISYHKKYDGRSGCVVDKASKVAKNDDSCDADFTPYGVHSCIKLLTTCKSGFGLNSSRTKCIPSVVKPSGIDCKGGSKNVGYNSNLKSYYCRQGTLTGGRSSVHCPAGGYHAEAWAQSANGRTYWACHL